MQLRIFHPAGLSFRIEGKIKSFQDKQKLKEFVITKPALQDILRGILQAKREPQSNRPERHNLQKQGLYRQYNGNKFISFNSYSECKWAKCYSQKTQGIRLDKKNRTHPYAVYKRLVFCLFVCFKILFI